MSKQKTPPTVRTAGSIFVLTGALVALAGSQMSLSAQLSGQGTAIGTQHATELSWTTGEAVMAAAPQQGNPSAVLAFGMLMMLIGFGMHSWYILNKQEGRPVAVHVRKHKAKKPQATKKSSRKSRRQADVIWIERTIRF